MKESKSISRRRFLKRSAAAGAAALAAPAIVPASVFGAAGRAAPSERIVIGMIGVGYQSIHLERSLLNQPDTQVVATCDVDRNKRERAKKMAEDYYAGKQDLGAYNGCKAYLDFRELIARDDIDAVCIATPDHWHAIPSIQAAQAGKDIYCEKPLSLNLEEARAMVTAVRRYGRVFQTGSMQRSMWQFRVGCELVRNGYIGELQTVTANIGGPSGPCALPPEPTPADLDWDRWLGPAPVRPYNKILAPPIEIDGFPNWRAYRDYSGGGMTDWGAHHFDISQWGIGADDTGPVEILPPDGGEVKDLTYLYKNGVKLFRAGGVNGVMFRGAKGWVEVNRGYIKTEPESLMSVKLGPGDVQLYNSNNHFRDWLDCIKTRNKPICDVEIGCRSVSVCHLGNIAYQLQRPLKWNPEKEEFIGDDEANRLRTRAMRAPWHL